MTMENGRPVTDGCSPSRPKSAARPKVLVVPGQHRQRWIGRLACLAEVDAPQRRQPLFERFEKRQGLQAERRRLGKKLDPPPPGETRRGGPVHERPARAFLADFEGRRKAVGQQLRALVVRVDRSMDGATDCLDGLSRRRKPLKPRHADASPPTFAIPPHSPARRRAAFSGNRYRRGCETPSPTPAEPHRARHRRADPSGCRFARTRAVGDRQAPEQRHLELLGAPSPFGMAIAQSGPGGDPAGRLVRLRLLDPLVALHDAHVMRLRDRDIRAKYSRCHKLSSSRTAKCVPPTWATLEKACPILRAAPRRAGFGRWTRRPSRRSSSTARVSSPLPSSRTIARQSYQVWASRLSSARRNRPGRLKVELSLRRKPPTGSSSHRIRRRVGAGRRLGAAVARAVETGRLPITTAATSPNDSRSHGCLTKTVTL